MKKKQSKPGTCIKRLILLSLIALILCLFERGYGMHPKLDFDVTVQAADLIFIGTVKDKVCRYNSKGNLIVTDVTFEQIKLILMKNPARKTEPETLTLTFAGGQVGNLSLSLSDEPSLRVGEKYLIFALDDGNNYFNPIIGADQGLFMVQKDEKKPVEYPLFLGRSCITAVEHGKLKSAPGISYISNGIPHQLPDVTSNVPAPQGPGPYGPKAQSRKHIPPASVMNVDDFIFEIVKILATPVSENMKDKILHKNTHAQNNSQNVSKTLMRPSGTSPKAKSGIPLPDTLETAVDTIAGLSLSDDSGIMSVNSMSAVTTTTPITGYSLCWCGAYDLPLVMEQMPESHWTYGQNFDAMNIYNLFMNIYRYTSDDGHFGNNYESEFAGFPSDAQIKNAYGYSWGTAYAKAITWIWYGDCGEIIEADVMFRPDLNWKANFEDTYNNSGTVLYRPLVMHELGHSWGYMTGGSDGCDEKGKGYHYNRLSVMHAYYDNIVEDGLGIHMDDAYAIRHNYDDQRSIENITDIGVESYYPDSGLHNSTLSPTLLTTDNDLTVHDVCIENMSNTDVSGLRVRMYLSEDQNITPSDYLMGDISGTYVEWGTFPYNNWWMGDITASVPSTVPTGEYYVGLIVTVNGANYWTDDFPQNNQTFMHDKVNVVCAAPSALTNLSASDGTESAYVNVSWDAPTTPVSYFEIWRWASGAGWVLVQPSWTVLGYHDSDTDPGTEYTYKVKAVSLCGSSSGYSNMDSGWRSGTCDVPPDYTYPIAPSGDWKVTETRSFAMGGCHVYRMYLTAGRSYDFSLCSNDGSGASCPVGDGSFSLFDASGKLLWTLDGGYGCSYDATTIGSSKENWTPSSTGYYYLRVFEKDGNPGLKYNLAYKHICPNPAAPTNVTATNGRYCDYVLVSWDPVAGAGEYQVVRTGSYAHDYYLSPWQTGTYFLDYTANPLKVYNYQVMAYNYCGGSELSEPATGRLLWTPPSPSHTDASDGTFCDRVRISWTDMQDAAYYQVYRDGVAISGWQSYWVYEDTDVLPGEVHTYQIKSKNNCSESGLNAGDAGYCSELQIPTNVMASDDEYEDKVAILWSPVPGATGYQVVRDGFEISPWITDTFYTDYTADYCTSYKYKVMAKDACGQVTVSAEDTGSWGRPARPAIPSPAISDQHVSVNTILSWSGDPDMILLDDFNRPDSTDLGASWTQQTGTCYIENQKARCSDSALITYNPRGNDRISADLIINGAGNVQHAALVLGYADPDNHLYIKVDGKNDYQRLFFYFGRNGSNNFAWANSGILVLSSPFTSARMTAMLQGDTVTVEFDTDFDGIVDQTYSRDGIPTGLLGSGIGLGGHGQPIIDNFGFAADSIYPTVTEHIEDFVHPTITPSISTGIGGERSVAVDINSTVTVSALSIKAGINQATDLTVTIRPVIGTVRGTPLASATIPVAAGSLMFHEIPIDFTFQAGQRYDIGFNVTGNWGTVHQMELYTSFFNSSLSPSLGFDIGDFKVLSGGEWSGAGYGNSYLPHIQAKVAESCHTVYDIYVDDTFPPMTLLKQGHASNQFNIYAETGSLLESFTTYYWKIKARNCCGEIESPVWAFETELVGDFDADAKVDMRDLAYLALHWMFSDCGYPDWCGRTDLSFSANVFAEDLTIYADQWLSVGQRYRDLEPNDISTMDSKMTANEIDGSDGNELGSGTFFVYMTDQGRYGKFIVEDLNPSLNNQLTIAWVTYNLDGSVYSAGNNLIIHGTYTCDLDEGLETTAGSDFFWKLNTSTSRSLMPVNNSRIALVRRFK